MEYFSPEENAVFALARRLFEDFVSSREGYEPKVEWGLFASSGSHMRMHLRAVPRREGVPTVMYRQWLLSPSGTGTCGLSAGESSSTLELNFRQPQEVIEVQFLSWLSRELPQ